MNHETTLKLEELSMKLSASGRWAEAECATRVLLFRRLAALTQYLTYLVAMAVGYFLATAATDILETLRDLF